MTGTILKMLGGFILFFILFCRYGGYYIITVSYGQSWERVGSFNVYLNKSFGH